jgi:hypothetical protein
MKPHETGLRVWGKLAILAISAALVGVAIHRCSRTERPFKDGNPADFWYAACRVQVDPARRSHCTGPVYPAREGWFVYGGQDERGIAIHGVESYRIPEHAALTHFPAVVRQLEGGAHRGARIPHHGQIVDEGYRKWLAANPERTDAQALLVCIRDARLDWWRAIGRVPAATLAASAVAAWAQPGGQPWAAVMSILEAEDRLHVFRPGADPESSVRYHLDGEKHIDEWWEHTRYWHWSARGEFGYLTALLLFAAWPWLRELRPWQWGLHLGLLPILFFLPYWLGYACFSSASLGPSGGVLYPSLVLHLPQLPAVPLDGWVWKLFPRLLASWSYPFGNNPLVQTHLLSGSFRGGGPGPVSTLAVGFLLGLLTYGVRKALDSCRSNQAPGATKEPTG